MGLYSRSLKNTIFEGCKMDESPLDFRKLSAPSLSIRVQASPGEFHSGKLSHIHVEIQIRRQYKELPIHGFSEAKSRAA